ncbi:MAG: bifunctional methylenetetrahydrofolate dehydrogenase/methenyltetrahydrofolate cyclohydrolase FolD [Candidatus Marinimicrobia bacterium]|jgi:methylenetetrahydrofolate dehydrogenase (NADP+)/methenyltetrahydrofolate cyclohydrolase|nr:bifunctional methylenetetrahydrofolate dehydrogenase/methenyltetrahydrofolate cyclohydrolase FolD [Candidatus Neomarinimicrobiota bacterium]
METKILSGREVSKFHKNRVRENILDLKKKGIIPGLAVVLVGDDPASKIYVNSKSRTCSKLGIFSKTLTYSNKITQTELIMVIEKLNKDKQINGILVQMPLPSHIDEFEIINRISPEKDVDGFHPENLGKLVIGKKSFVSCTPAGILAILKYYNISIEGKHVVIIGRSNIVGKPLLNLLYQKNDFGNATVTICHSKTKNLSKITSQADVLIVAAGNPNMITVDMVKEESVIIDVGINRIKDKSTKKGYKIVGDVDFEGVKNKVSAITPVPGGVGPMTITMLMQNTLEATLRTI